MHGQASADQVGGTAVSCSSGKGHAKQSRGYNQSRHGTPVAAAAQAKEGNHRKGFAYKGNST